MNSFHQSCLSRAAALVLAAGLAASAQAQTLGTSFTYQGELANAGSPATGTYDVQFRLYTSAAEGSQIGATLCSNDLAIVNGRFASILDFGAVFTGGAQYLEIAVREDTGLDCSDESGYTTLLPRQELTAAPNASFASTAANASSFNGQDASFYQDAANLIGTLNSERLSDDVARRVGNQTFSGSMSVQAPAGNSVIFSARSATSNAGLAVFDFTPFNDTQLVAAFAARTGTVPQVRFGGLGGSFTDIGLDADNNFLVEMNDIPFLSVLAGGGLLSSGAVTATSFVGSGQALTDLDASKLTSGVLPNDRFAGNYTSRVNLTNQTNIFIGTFGGDGQNLTNLNAANVATGVFASAQIPNLDASKISTGTLGVARIPNLDASKITSGFVAAARLPAGGAWSLTSNLNIDSNTLVVDQLNARVGIGTATPAYPLDVAGSAQLGSSARLQFNGRGHIQTSEFLYLNPFTGGGNVIVGGGGGSGNMQVVGSLSKGGGSFKIDHPLDPENKYLYHSFVESPDMMNVYNGNITTDASGYATITMPDYFEALNRDFRYQLTVINEADTGEFLWAQVVRELKNNQFTIRSSRADVKVSWQITGIRQDAWANKNRIPNSIDKPASEKGKLLHPEAFNQPVEKSVHFAVPAAASNQ